MTHNLIQLDLITLIFIGEYCKACSSSLYNFMFPTISLYL